ncbi:MAG: phage portal protein [Opitutales bacterium]|nr:phage portal protein [Opitutales bacterium]
MSIIGKIFASTTSMSDFRNPRNWMMDAFGGQTHSGENVTAESSLGLSGYWHALRSISEDIGKIPLITYQKVSPKGKLESIDHPLHRLLDEEPNPNMTAQAFKETMTSHALGLGNGYADIQFSRSTGDVQAMWPIHPSRVEVKIQNGRRTRLVYRVHNDDGSAVDLPQTRVFHLHGLSMDGVKGYSVFRIAAQSIGLGLAVETFGSTFFGNGTHLRGAVTHPAALSDKAYEHLRESWADTYQGSANAHKFAILEEGMQWVRMGVEPEAAQFLSTREFTVEEMARWFRMPVQKMGILIKAGAGGAKMSDEDVQSLYVTDTLLPWMVRWEQETKRKLFTKDDEKGHFASFRVSGMLRGSSEARADFNSKLFHIGSVSQNDIRESEGMNPIPNGDTYYVPVNLVPDSFASKGHAGGVPAPNEKRPRQPEGDQTETNRKRDESDRESDQGAPSRRQGAIAAFHPLFVEAFSRLLKREQNAITRAAKKHAKDVDSFVRWMDDFAEGQRELGMELIEGPKLALAKIVGAKDSFKIPGAIDRVIDDFRSIGMELYRRDPSKLGSAWEAFNEGRDEELAAALLGEYETEWNGSGDEL